MYSTCIFCHSSLGTNEAIEHFPVGRRLAFDEAKGRLWAVCAKCGRWNLTPIEERWEAIEECERQYRETLKRASTDEIGLGRVGEGTDLIRIGKPMRPEFVAWRYTRHFVRRRHLSQLRGFAETALVIGGSASGLLVLGATPLILNLLWTRASRGNEIGRSMKFLRSRVIQKGISKYQPGDVPRMNIIPTDDDQGWGIRIASRSDTLELMGADARHAAHLGAPALNIAGASAQNIEMAVREIENSQSPALFFERILDYNESTGWQHDSLRKYPVHMRIAFEMAAHEETEREAMEGELAQLEADWREAEEVASISDNMFVPAAISDFIQRLKGAPTSNPESTPPEG